MPIVSKTKREIRRDVLNASFGEFTVLTGETASSTSSSSIVFSQFAGLMPDSHWDKATIRVTVSGVAESRKVGSFDGDTCTFTPITNFSGSPATTNIEIIRAGVNLTQVDTAIERAANALARLMLKDVTDSTSLIYDPSQSEYLLPSSTFTRIDDEGGIEFSWGMKNADRFYIPWTSLNLTEKTITASTTAYAQGFTTIEEILVDGIALPLRKVGSPDYTLTASIRTDSSGVASTVLGSMTALAATVISVNRMWAYFTTTTPVRLAPDTAYHVALAPTSGATLDSTNYYAWLADTGGSGVNGAPSTSSNSGSTFTAASGYTRGFRLTDAREKDWRKLESDDWYTVNGSTRSITIKPDNWPSPPVPMRIRGQGAPASIAGTSNDGTTYDGDPEILTKLAVSYLQMATAMAKKDTASFSMAKKNEEDALDWARKMMPRGRGVVVERL